MNAMTSRPPLVLTLMLLGVSLLTGCAGMLPGYETPTVSVQSFRPIASENGSGLPAFEVRLHVVNPNLEPLKLAGVSYTISLEGQDLIKGVGNELPVIDGYGDGTITLTAGFNVIAGIQLFRSLLAKDDDRFDYSFSAKLDPGAFRRKIRVSDSGSIAFATR